MKDFKEIMKYFLCDHAVPLVIILMFIVLFLTGCATTNKEQVPAVKVVTQTVDVPIAVACLKKEDVPVKEDYVTIKINKTDQPVAKVKKMRYLINQQVVYIDVLQKTIDNCVEQD